MNTLRRLRGVTLPVLLHRARHAAWAVWVSPRLMAVAERAVLGLTPRPRAVDGAPSEHVLLGPPGGGNIGDQAMVEAFIESVDGPVVVVASDASDLVVPAPLAHRGRVVALPALVYGGGLPHLRDVLELRRLLTGARSLSVVGADLMDGGYGYRGPVTLARTVARAARSGLPSRVLGFSWSASPHPRARRALRNASRDGVDMVLRDPVSAGRARGDGIEHVVDAADVVFSGTLVELPPRSELPRHGHVVVNVSGLVHARRDLVEPFTDLVRRLRERDLVVVLLPHVRRPGGDDVAVCRTVADRFADDDGVLLVDAVLRPAQVRGVVRGARLVVTGRMHLAILALSQSVPAVCLSTQGKVEGLMKLVGTDQLCVVPDDGLEEALPRVVLGALDDREALAARVAASLPRLRRMSAANADGLRRPDEVGTP